MWCARALVWLAMLHTFTVPAESGRNESEVRARCVKRVPDVSSACQMCQVRARCIQRVPDVHVRLGF